MVGVPMLKAERISCSDPKLSDAQTCNFEAIKHIVSRVEADAGVSEAARQMGVSRQAASKWLAHARRGKPTSDKSSRPHRLARLTPPDAEARAREAHSSMLLRSW